MRIYPLLMSFILVFSTFSFADTKKSNQDFTNFQEECLKDIDFFRKQLITNSAIYKEQTDKKFHNWFDEGYKHAKELIADIGDNDDCFYVMKYYVNGFGNSHISVRSYVQLPQEQYPGFLTALYGHHHTVIYKNPKFSYLNELNIGDVITHINDIPINDYFSNFILPFYANDESEFPKRSASIFNFIVDGNKFKPIPLKTTFINSDSKSTKTIDLKFTNFEEEAVEVAKTIRQPDPEQKFKVEMISDGVWISIPSFYLSREESVFFTGMLSKLKELAKEDYIIFDLRGNKGGAARWARPIIRNLWGDDYIKSLGKKHDYNTHWIKKVRVSESNFLEFKKTANENESKAFAEALKQKKVFFEKKWKIFDEKLNLYTNKDSSPFRARIYVLTDHFCRSTCWSLVNEMTQIPGVVHIGTPTASQNTSSYAVKVRSPSEKFDFFYPTEIKIQPQRNMGKTLIPSKIFNGNLRNESEVVNWVMSITEAED